MSLRSNTVSVSPTRGSDSSGKWERPPVAMMPTFHGLLATTRAMCWPKAKQRRAVGCGGTEQVTQMGTRGGSGRAPRIGLPGREPLAHPGDLGHHGLHRLAAHGPTGPVIVFGVQHMRHRARKDDLAHWLSLPPLVPDHDRVAGILPEKASTRLLTPARLPSHHDPWPHSPGLH